MKTKISSLYASFFGLIFGVFLPKIAGAVVVNPPNSNLPGAPSIYANTEPSKSDSLFSGLIAYTIGVVAVLAVIAITWSGIQMFLSVGNESKFNEARNIMIYAFVGVAVAGLAYGLVGFISNFNF